MIKGSDIRHTDHAIGLPGRIEELPEQLQARETPNDRRPLTQTICEGAFSL